MCHLDAVEVVHSQDGAPLVLVADEAETFGLPRLLVAHQVDVDDFTVPAGVQEGEKDEDPAVRARRTTSRRRAGTYWEKTQMRSPSVSSYGNPPAGHTGS